VDAVGSVSSDTVTEIQDGLVGNSGGVSESTSSSLSDETELLIQECRMVFVGSQPVVATSVFCNYMIQYMRIDFSTAPTAAKIGSFNVLCVMFSKRIVHTD